MYDDIVRIDNLTIRVDSRMWQKFFEINNFDIRKIFNEESFDEYREIFQNLYNGNFICVNGYRAWHFTFNSEEDNLAFMMIFFT